MGISNVTFIHFLYLTRSSCEKFQQLPKILYIGIALVYTHGLAVRARQLDSIAQLVRALRDSRIYTACVLVLIISTKIE
jgi:hypothetical protein